MMRILTQHTGSRVVALLAAVLAGCASYDGSGLVPGKSSAAEVEQLMGAPRERLAEPGGGSVWFYPKAPYGPHTYAVRLGADGVVKSVEQRLTMENMQKLVAGATTAKEVRQLFGPPYRVTRLDRQKREVWDYPMRNPIDMDYNLYVQFSDDGVVREVLFLRHPRYDVGGPGWN